jgi:hypothetical protein
MPINHTLLDLVDVISALRRRGYAFHSQYETGLRLTKPDMTADGVFKETKRRKRVLLIPISKNHVTEILTYSRNVAEAAEQIEKMSLGVQDAPSFSHNAAPAAPAGLDADVVDKLISNRVANELAKQQAAADAKLAEMRKQLEETQQKLEAASKQVKRPAKKAAKKARKPARKVDDTGLPELTEEEQTALDAAMRQAALDISE